LANDAAVGNRKAGKPAGPRAYALGRAGETACPTTNIELPALAAEATATTTWTIRLGTGFIDVEHTAIHVSTIQGGNGFVAFPIVSHLDKPKTAGLSGVAIGANVDTLYGAVSFKQ
jgi:hypothetical protein